MNTGFDGWNLHPVGPPPPLGSGYPKRILIVDPEDTLTWSLSRGLFRNHPDFRVLVAHQGGEALHLLKEEPIDLVLSEVKLPDFYWLDFLEKVIHISPQARLVFMASYGYQELEALARERGVKDWITKPFEIATLRETIAHSLDTPTTVSSGNSSGLCSSSS